MQQMAVTGAHSSTAAQHNLCDTQSGGFAQDGDNNHVMSWLTGQLERSWVHLVRHKGMHM
jgi:hypothetical protein